MHRESPAYRDFDFDGEMVSATLRRLIAGGGCVIVFEIEGVVVAGFVAILIDNWFSRDKTASDIALFVEPEHRNKAIASTLLHVYVGWAREMGVRRATLGVTAGIQPEATGRLYESFGFRPAGTFYSMDFGS